MGLMDLTERWLSETGPSALVMEEYLIPVGGRNVPIFPPTFAPAKGEERSKEPYVLDELPDGRTTCIIDTVESQANRMEILFLKELAHLVPQIKIKAGNKVINLLEAGHRVADAIVRYSTLSDKITEAFEEYQKGNALPMARIAPTSLLFGVWDSRETQVKIPRMIRSEIRAFNVDLVHRAMQYKAPVDYVKEGLLTEEELEQKVKDTKVGSLLGFCDVPSGKVVGGVILRENGYILRQAVFNLELVRDLNTRDETLKRKLQRYILALGLAVLTTPQKYYLREGCHLCRDPSKPPTSWQVFRNGVRQEVRIDYEEVLKFAESASKEFEVEREEIIAKFLPDKAREKIKSLKSKS